MRDDLEAQDRIAEFLASVAAATSVEISAFEPLRGGSVQQNYRLDTRFADGPFAGAQNLVLRTNSQSKLMESRSRSEEFHIQRLVFDAGVRVPEPLWLCDDRAVIGDTFYIMRKISGSAWGPEIVTNCANNNCGEEVGEMLGAELARIHAISHGLPGTEFLGAPDARPLHDRLSNLQVAISALPSPQPILEWGLHWLQKAMPDHQEVVLAHRDFRTGNYMLDGIELTGLLDWEFSGWSDPHEDIGWFCARCWRFGNFDLEAGGIANRDAFYRGYERESGRKIDPRSTFWCEVLAHLRWAVIAIEQGERHASGVESSLDLALTSRRAAEVGWELLAMTSPSELPLTEHVSV